MTTCVCVCVCSKGNPQQRHRLTHTHLVHQHHSGRSSSTPGPQYLEQTLPPHVACAGSCQVHSLGSPCSCEVNSAMQRIHPAHQAQLQGLETSTKQVHQANPTQNLCSLLDVFCEFIVSERKIHKGLLSVIFTMFVRPRTRIR